MHSRAGEQQGTAARFQSLPAAAVKVRLSFPSLSAHQNSAQITKTAVAWLIPAAPWVSLGKLQEAALTFSGAAELLHSLVIMPY